MFSILNLLYLLVYYMNSMGHTLLSRSSHTNRRYTWVEQVSIYWAAVSARHWNHTTTLVVPVPGTVFTLRCLSYQ